MSSNNIIVALSGGLDSATMLAQCIAEGGTPFCISFYYGSKHNEYENKASIEIAEYYKVPLKHIDISGITQEFHSTLLKSGGEIPEGYYTDKNMSQTVVPARNLIFLSILAGIANSRDISTIGIAVHQGDHAIYPDCRPNFISSVQKTIELATDGQLNNLYTPFLFLTKTDIVKIGLDLSVPYHLTRTCYKEQELACGHCGACTERLEAFKLNGKEDPILYEGIIK